MGWDLHGGERNDLGIDHQRFSRAFGQHGSTQSEDVAGGDGEWTDQVIAALPGVNEIFKIRLCTWSYMDHRLKAVRSCQRHWQCLTKFQPRDRHPAIVLYMQVDLDSF